MKSLTVIVHVGVVLLSVQIATGTILSFEEIHGTNTGTSVGFTNYGGLVWGNVLAARFSPSSGYTGFVTGLTDGITGAVTTAPAGGIYTVHVAAPTNMTYTFNGSYITSFANNYQPIELFGYRPGDTGYTNLAIPGSPTFHISITANTASATGTFKPPSGGATPTFYTANFTGIDRLIMVSYSGSNSIFGGSSANSFMLDEFTLNEPIPEPATLALVIVGGLAVLWRKRK